MFIFVFKIAYFLYKKTKNVWYICMYMVYMIIFEIFMKIIKSKKKYL